MELLTASRMASLLACPRRHYWRYECGLRKAEGADALRFGTAWHRAMEALGSGLETADAYQEALCAGGEFDEATAVTLWGLLDGYVARWGGDRFVEVLHRELEFRLPIDGSRTFEAAGKIDGLGKLADGRLAVVEYKTTGSSIDAGSDYWLRLRADAQILGYVAAARATGWDVSTVIYDVTRKPAIRQRQNETPEAFGERLAADCRERPEFYFCRREVPVLDQDLEEFADLRVQVGRMILDRRTQQRRLNAGTPWRAWPRHVNGMLCPSCEYAGFCLANAIPDLAHPPAGFAVGAIHTELTTAAQ